MITMKPHQLQCLSLAQMKALQYNTIQNFWSLNGQILQVIYFQKSINNSLAQNQRYTLSQKRRLLLSQFKFILWNIYLVLFPVDDPVEIEIEDDGDSEKHWLVLYGKHGDCPLTQSLALRNVENALSSSPLSTSASPLSTGQGTFCPATYRPRTYIAESCQ